MTRTIEITSVQVTSLTDDRMTVVRSSATSRLTAGETEARSLGRSASTLSTVVMTLALGLLKTMMRMAGLPLKLPPLWMFSTPSTTSATSLRRTVPCDWPDELVLVAVGPPEVAPTAVLLAGVPMVAAVEMLEMVVVTAPLTPEPLAPEPLTPTGLTPAGLVVPVAPVVAVPLVFDVMAEAELAGRPVDAVAELTGPRSVAMTRGR